MRVQIEHRIGVQVPASEVWRHLSDIPGWADWNPMYPDAAGKLQIGAVLQLTEVIPGDKPRKITPSVVDWVPDSQILWTQRVARGWLRRIRYLEIQTLTETACVFSNGEVYEGFFARFIPKKRRRALREGFTRLGEAMKARAEASAPDAGAAA